VTSIPPEGATTGELALLDRVREVQIPYSGDEYVCPSCSLSIPTRKQIRLSKPARWEQALNDVFKCPFCNYIFSPRTMTAHVVTG
jgi:hypothetical protein